MTIKGGFKLLQYRAISIQVKNIHEFFFRYRLFPSQSNNNTTNTLQHFPQTPPHLQKHTYTLPHHIHSHFGFGAWGRWLMKKKITPKETNISDLLTSFFHFLSVSLSHSFLFDVAKHQQQQCFNIQITKMCTLLARAHMRLCVCERAYVCALLVNM